MDKTTKILLDYTSGKTPLEETNHALEDAGSDTRQRTCSHRRSFWQRTPARRRRRRKATACWTPEPGAWKRSM